MEWRRCFYLSFATVFVFTVLQPKSVCSQIELNRDRNGMTGLIARSVRTGHPRVFITPESLEELKQRVETDRREIYTDIVNRLHEDWYREQMNEVGWSARGGIEAWGLLALLTEDPNTLRRPICAVSHSSTTGPTLS